MTHKNSFTYRSFTLRCDPLRAHGGSFGAQVKVTDAAGNLVQSAVYPELDAFDSEEAAIAQARDVGRRLVDTIVDPEDW